MRNPHFNFALHFYRIYALNLLFANTLTTNAGHRYERSRIESWLFTNSTSPMDKSPLANKQLIPNRDMYNPASTTTLLNASIYHHDNPSTFPQQAEARFHLPQRARSRCSHQRVLRAFCRPLAERRGQERHLGLDREAENYWLHEFQSSND